MRLLSTLKNIINKLYASTKRFPLSIFFSILIAALLIIIAETKPISNTLGRITMTFSLGIPLTLCTRLYFEKKNVSNILKTSIIYCLNIVFLIFYYLLFLDNLKMTAVNRYIAISLALYLIFLFIPYFYRKANFEKYVITLLSAFFLTVIYSAFMYAGLSAILFAIDKLIGIKILSKYYYYSFIMVTFIFAVPYFLGMIPLDRESVNIRTYPKALRILLLYIIMPLLTVYTAILYIYLGKIIVTKIWPIGMVSNLVLWYSVIAAIVLFFITPFKTEDKWASLFYMAVPKVLLPILIMMFISIGIRVNAYGITERRYYVIVLAIWVLCIMLYFNFSRKIKNILLPISLCFLSIISVFGPISSFSVSKMSQNERFQKILIKNNMLLAGKIKSSSSVSNEDKINLSSILSYFNNYHSFVDMKYLPASFKIDDMPDVFGFSYEYPMSEYSEQNYFYIQSSQKALNIMGYDYLFDMRSMNSTQDALLTSKYDYETGELKLISGGKTIYQKNINNISKEIISKYSSNTKETVLSEEEMTISDENDKVKVKIVLSSISGNRDVSNQKFDAKGNDFYFLVKLK
ncbi:DUF4153 domain-containing protein [Candidatus Clostridium stratigraminis]|uniref:DUF4153 domain-containing protein n=1 Tax=Candidatus Clostridium stratigraminis TaxID=3381661 RepID=A0ABW8T116_9CLOT